MRRAFATATLAFAIAFAIPMAAPAQEQSRPTLSDMSETERTALRTEIRAYLLENPEVLMEAIQILEARRTANAQQDDMALIAANREQLFSDPNAWVTGNPEGDVTVVEFADYRCGYCKKAHPELKELLRLDPNIRLVVKEFPILGPDSVAAARMALAAVELDPANFEELNDALMSFEGQLTETTAYQIARSIGYDVAALKERATSAEIDAQLGDNYALAQSMGLQGTPSFVFVNQIIRGYVPLEQMQAAVAEVRAAVN